jgi:hypothetical protein
MMKIKDLVKNLKTKDQDAEVEFIVCKTTGELVCMLVDSKAATDIIKMMKLFGNKD